MVVRVKQGYKGGEHNDPIAVFPVLALACEGETEVKYSQTMSRKAARIRIKPELFRGKHGTSIIDEAVEYAERMRDEYDADTEIIPAAMYDLETTSDHQLLLAKQEVDYANSRGVKIWVTAPTIERWFLLHFAHFGVNRGRKVAESELQKIIATQKKIPYRKPGSARFYEQLLPLIPTAMMRCRTSHLIASDGTKIPCLCDFFEFLADYDL